MNQNIFPNKSQLIVILLIGLLGFAVLIFAQRTLNVGTVNVEPLSDAKVSTFERSEVGIDPADRKFFSNNFNIENEAASQTGVLAGIDPADRKFFSNNFNIKYQGAALPDFLNQVDPADRKFFSRSY